MKIYKFIILRKGKEIFNSTIEAPTYKTAYREYLSTIEESEIKIMPFDICIGSTVKTN